MSSTKHIRSIMSMVEEIGLKAFATIDCSGRHGRITITGPLGCRKAPLSKSPSDHRALLNLRTDLRRLGREVGVFAA